MPECSYCHGKGIIAPSGTPGLPMKCYRCAGNGVIEWKDLRPGDHVCYFYDAPAVQLETIATYLVEGLKNGERTIYVYNHHTPKDILDAISAHQLDVKAEQARGALILLTAQEAYMPQGFFDVTAVFNLTKELLKKTLQEGYRGIRAASEMDWALDSPKHSHELIGYELMMDHFFMSEQPPITGVCQYERKRFPGIVVEGMEHAHRLVFQD